MRRGDVRNAAERFGSGDGEWAAPMVGQMPYEPLPASVLFALVLVIGIDNTCCRCRPKVKCRQDVGEDGNDSENHTICRSLGLRCEDTERHHASKE